MRLQNDVNAIIRKFREPIQGNTKFARQSFDGFTLEAWYKDAEQNHGITVDKFVSRT